MVALADAGCAGPAVAAVMSPRRFGPCLTKLPEAFAVVVACARKKKAPGDASFQGAKFGETRTLRNIASQTGKLSPKWQHIEFELSARLGSCEILPSSPITLFCPQDKPPMCSTQQTDCPSMCEAWRRMGCHADQTIPRRSGVRR